MDETFHLVHQAAGLSNQEVAAGSCPLGVPVAFALADAAQIVPVLRTLQHVYFTIIDDAKRFINLQTISLNTQHQFQYLHNSNIQQVTGEIVM